MEEFKVEIKTFENYIDNFIKNLNDNKVYDPIKYFLKLPSKRIRPLLTITAHSFYNDTADHAFSAALANEIFHNFTLVHDDVMDSSKIRRGSETVHVKWNLNQAILSGDAMQILAYKCLEDYESKIQKELIKIFNDTALKICEGQQLDIEFEKNPNTHFTDYMKMIEFKTAVLLASSLQMGGLINNANENDLKLLYKIGLNMGLAFQIQDDYLDLFGEEKIIGKKIGADVLMNKKTVLYHIFKDSSTSKVLNDFNKIYKNSEIEDDIKIKKIRNIYVNNKVDLKCQGLVKKYSSICINSLDDLAISRNKKKNLEMICMKLLSRDY